MISRTHSHFTKASSLFTVLLSGQIQVIVLPLAVNFLIVLAVVCINTHGFVNIHHDLVASLYCISGRPSHPKP